jgi:hypothetical protein
MKKLSFFARSISVTPLVIAALCLALASCMPIVDTVSEQAAPVGGAESGPRGGTPGASSASIVVTVGDAASSSGGPSRSVTPAQIPGLVNYYEIIANKLSLGAGNAPTGEFVSSRIDSGGNLSLAVDIGERYNILLLAGYRPPSGGEPVLLRSGFVAGVGPIGAGANSITVSLSDIVHDPVNDLSMIRVAQPDIAVQRNSYNTAYILLPVRTDPALSGNPVTSVAVSVDGIKPLSDAGLDFAAFTALVPKLSLVPYLRDGTFEQWIPDEVWNGLTNIAGGGVAGDNLNVRWWAPSLTKFPDNDSDALLRWDIGYYGFVRSASGGVPAWTAADAQGAGFTRWHIQNGLDDSVDTANMSGGSVFVRVGRGSGLFPGETAATPPPGTFSTFAITAALSGVDDIVVSVANAPVPAPAHYALYYVPQNTSDPLTIKGGRALIVPANLFPFTIRSLAAETEYSILLEALRGGYTRTDAVAHARTPSLADPSFTLTPAATGITVTITVPTAVPVPTSYEIYYKQGTYTAAQIGQVATGTPAATITSITPPTITYAITGLTESNEYGVVVKAAKSGYTSKSALVSATTSNGMVKPVFALTAGAESIDIAMNAPASPVPDGWDIYCMAGDQTLAAVVQTPNLVAAGHTSTSYTVTGLLGDQTYSVATVAKRSGYTDVPSDVVKKTTLSLAAPVFTLAPAATGMTVTITVPTAAPVPTGYEIYYKQGTYTAAQIGQVATGAPAATITSITPPTVTYTITGLTESNAYSVAVTATRPGHTSRSALMTATTLPGMATPAFTLTPGDGRLELSLTAPSAPVPDSWDVYIVQGDGVALATVTAAANKEGSFTASATPYILVTLADHLTALTDKKYSVAVIAKKSGYTDVKSVVVTGSPLPLVPPVFTLTAGALPQAAGGTGSLAVSITNAAAVPATAAWDVYIAQGDGIAPATVVQAANKVGTVTAPATTYTVTTLGDGITPLTDKKYSVVLVATRSNYTDVPSLTKTEAPLPLLPPVFTVQTGTDMESLIVTITPPAATPVPDTWDIYCLAGSSGLTVAQVNVAANRKAAGITSTTYTVTGLADYQTYGVVVSANKTGYTSVPSASVQYARTPKAAYLRYENYDTGAAQVHGIKYLVLYRLENNTAAYDSRLYGLDGSVVYETPYTTPQKIFPRYPGARAEPLGSQSDAVHTLGTYSIPVTTFTSGMKINRSAVLYFNPALMLYGQKEFKINAEYKWALCWVSISTNSSYPCYRGGVDLAYDTFFDLNLPAWNYPTASNPLRIRATAWHNNKMN